MSNITIYRFALDMTPGGVTPVVHLSQYDEAFQLEFTLYSRSGELDIPSGATAMIEGTKLDGKAYSANAAISGNVVTVTGDVQISAVAGNNPFQIVLKSGNSTIGSANFTIAVERAALDYDTVSDSKLAQIQDISGTAAQLTAAAENVTDGVETFEALAESVSDMLADITDDTLSIADKAADAAAVGNALAAEIAPKYSTSATYEVGDYVLYNNSLYRCNTAITTAESWTAAHWTAVKVVSELSNLKSEISAAYPPLKSDAFTWVLGKTINSTTGNVSNNAATAVTNRIPVSKGSIIYNLSNPIGMNDAATSFMIAEYASGVFSGRSSVSSGSKRALRDDTTEINIVFGYFSSSGNVETQEDIDENFSVQIIIAAIDEIEARAFISQESDIIDVNSYATKLPNLNTLKGNCAVRLNFAAGSTNIPANTPYPNGWGSNRVSLLFSFVKVATSGNLGDAQIFVGSDGIYIRTRTGTADAAWQSWTLLANNAQSEISVLESSAIKSNSSVIDANSYATELPDLNDYHKNGIVRLNFSINSSVIPANTPYGSAWGSTGVATLISSASQEGTQKLGDTQIIIGSDGVYSRTAANTEWFAWERVANNYEEPKVITVDPSGNGDYTSFTAAVVDAQFNYQDATVYVKRGTYDAIAEAKALYGDDYFDNWGTSYGPISLRNGIKVVCEPGTILEAHYTGTSDAVMMYYSPVNFKYDATLEGLTIRASKVRYCIHDDLWDDTTPYKHYLKNVRLEIDNTQSTWTRKQAFGGGLGVCGYIQFDNCYFKAAGLNGSEYTGYSSCSFHNSPSANAQSRVVMNNCYFADNSTFRMGYHGQSTLISEAFLSGCSMGRAIEIVPESESSSIANVSVIDCNNIVRS